ncbi:MAG: cyclopropane-fatty-acyl-phospholipid synthase family protein [Bacillota bacterium]|nr:cyclopropane-fatty-acyl-phospholipid synthase family protein [Bacillota bacterium]
MKTDGAEEHRGITLEILENMFADHLPGTVRVRLWDGTVWPDPSDKTEAEIVLNHPSAMRAMLQSGTEVGLGEAFLYDDFNVTGNLESVFESADRIAGPSRSWGDKIYLGNLVRKLPPPPARARSRRAAASLSGSVHSQDRDRNAIAYHYDVSNDFYKIWLDKRMVYSCGYFRSPDDPLDDAQEQKLDLMCRKLRLRPGQTLLDIGCGWGALVAFAAANYGVHATGITLSEPQVEYAAELLESLGLSDRAQVSLLDYRAVTATDPYDAIVSVGMFEHVGRETLPVYFQKAFQLVKPGGVFLNHGIASGSARQEQVDRKTSFSQNYVFPDGELVPISTTLRVAHESGFEVRDLESFREHYQLTLRHWVRRLESNHDVALRYVDEPTYRVWRLFMAGGAYDFGSGNLNVYQALLVRPTDEGRSGVPLTREDWYQ